MNQALQNLNTTVDFSVDFIQKFTDASFFDRFWNNTNHQEEFESLNAQLSSNAANLNLALNIAQLFDRHQDMADLQADLTELLSKLDELAKTMAKQQQELCNQHNMLKDEWKRRFDSFRFHLQQDLFQARNSKEAKKMEEEAKLFLQIPGHDLLSEERIGQGAFADVYRGTWLSQHHRVAIKVIRINRLTDDVKQSFLNEVAAMYKIRYDHVLSVFGTCMEPNYYALVVEHMSLGSLFDVLQKKDRILSWNTRWSITLQMTKGINYIHMRSIIHRDIKSHNFLMEMTMNGYLVKVSDFGLAKIRQETSEQSTQVTGKQISGGTLKWKAPELLKFGRPSTASDIYSLGIVFWELATGCVPYNELDNEIIFQGVCAGNRLVIPNDVPSDFASIITNAWNQEPSKRPTCRQIIEKIKTPISSIASETAEITQASPSLPQRNQSDSAKLAVPLPQPVLYQMANLDIRPNATVNVINAHVVAAKDAADEIAHKIGDDLVETAPDAPVTIVSTANVASNLSDKISSVVPLRSSENKYNTEVLLPSTNIPPNATWKQNGIHVAGGNGNGDGLNQLRGPHGLYVDDDQTVYVTDWDNNRIMEWKYGATTGQVIAGGNGCGGWTNQLNYPTDVIVDNKTDNLIICDRGNRRVVQWARRGQTSGQTIIEDVACFGLTMDNDGFLYISDTSKNEVRRWRVGETKGTVVAGGNGKGCRFDQLNSPGYIFVDGDHSVYVSDCWNHRVMKWVKGAKEGIVVAGGQEQGNALTQLSNPQGVVVDQLGTVYVADEYNHRIMRSSQGSTEGCIVVGGITNQLNHPRGLSFDRYGNLYVVDQWNDRIARFSIDRRTANGVMKAIRRFLAYKSK